VFLPRVVHLAHNKEKGLPAGNKISGTRVFEYVESAEGAILEVQAQPSRFEVVMLPHLDAAYNLARWLVRNPTDAEDLVQEACLRALKGFSGFRGGDSRGWLLAIVRNTCYTWLSKNRRLEPVEFDEEVHTEQAPVAEPERLLARDSARQTLDKALQELPAEFREVIVLRELEELSYKEISEIAGVPVGTVMSRLARARTRLQLCLVPEPVKEA
jgi:RNA polymerase sigma-70 factor, ECF subfamily